MLENFRCYDQIKTIMLYIPIKQINLYKFIRWIHCPNPVQCIFPKINTHKRFKCNASFFQFLQEISFSRPEVKDGVGLNVLDIFGHFIKKPAKDQFLKRIPVFIL